MQVDFDGGGVSRDNRRLTKGCHHLADSDHVQLFSLDQEHGAIPEDLFLNCIHEFDPHSSIRARIGVDADRFR